LTRIVKLSRVDDRDRRFATYPTSFGAGARTCVNEGVPPSAATSTPSVRGFVVSSISRRVAPPSDDLSAPRRSDEVRCASMKFGVRTPSLKKRFAARTSLKRYVRHSIGVKAPRGWGWLTNPKRAAYNRVYNRTSVSVDCLARGGGAGVATSLLWCLALPLLPIVWLVRLFARAGRERDQVAAPPPPMLPPPPQYATNYSPMVPHQIAPTHDATYEPSRLPDPIAPPSTSDELVGEWIAKIQSFKGANARKNALHRALFEIIEPADRQVVILAASKIEAAAVIAKVRSLATPAAKRRHLDRVIAEIRSDDVPDEMQREEIALLEAELRDVVG
jgi:hypothetical protein